MTNLWTAPHLVPRIAYVFDLAIHTALEPSDIKR
jgi:hypothetical protein